MSDPIQLTTGIYSRLSAAAKEIGPIDKDSRNEAQSFNFRSIEAITGRVRSVFAEYGIGIVPRKIVSIESTPVSNGRAYRTVVIVQYSVGCDILVDVESGRVYRDELVIEMAGEAVDYGDKSTSKATQMAYKYALTEALVIGAEDADAHSPEIEAPRPPRNPVNELKRWLADEHGRDLAARAWGILFEDGEPDPEDLTEDRATDIRLAIESIVGDLEAAKTEEQE